jgi:hypothetical protein
MVVFREQRDRGLSQVCTSPEIQAKEALPFFVLQLPAGFAASGAHIGYDDIEATPQAVGFAQSLVDHSSVRKIAAEGDDGLLSELGFELCESFGQRLLSSTGDTDPAPFAQKVGGDGFANAARGAGNKGNAILQGEFHVVNLARQLCQ